VERPPAATDGTTANDGVFAGVGLVGTIISLIMTALYGALYGYFARREGTPVDVGNYAVGGGLTVALMTVVGLVLAVILGLLGLALPGVELADAGDVGALAGILTAAALLSLIVNFVIGAIGSAIYATTHRTETTTAPTL
jgi:hypothetical protein